MEHFRQPGGTPSPKETLDEVSYTKDTLDQSYDIVLVVEDGKQFKAHTNVLSEASPFFEKLLNSGMKESKERIVRLEMFSESLMAAALEFIYTGHVQKLTEDNSRELIVMADYLFLQKLKTFVEETLAQKLNISTANCISTYYFSQRYQCDEILSKSKKFILVNFTAVYAANREDVLNMSSKEVGMWISSDEIDVSAEEDVFKFILAWVDHDKSRRKKHFADLFRQVRLVYVSCAFLREHVVTNDLVKENEGCLKLVKDAMNLIDSEDCANLSVPPRKSLETPVIVTFNRNDIICYFPGEDSWCSLGDVAYGHWTAFQYRPAPFRGKLYALEERYLSNRLKQLLKIYNPYSNMWTELPFVGENRKLRKIFVKNDDEMYALASEQSTILDLGVIVKYKPISNSWENMSDSYEFRQDVCIVAKDNFIYFIGGTLNKIFYSKYSGTSLSDVDRYDISKNQWNKVADIQVARKNAHGAAVNGKIFVIGGDIHGKRLPRNAQCEMYDETSDSWQFIKCFDMKPEVCKNLLAIEGKLYAVGSVVCNAWGNRNKCERQHVRVECYNVEEDEWETKSEIAFHDRFLPHAQPCSLRLFKRFVNFRRLTQALYSPPDCLDSKTSSSPKSRETESHCFNR